MFFTILSRIIAVLALVYAALNLLLGFYIGSQPPESWDALLRRYTPASTPGELIDKGLLAILYAAVLGMLAEISASVRRSLKLQQSLTPDQKSKE
ncbi:hypothetical protein HPQ64_10325 [Rhizobiales bacterium]|uniref:hypothetical protein n=1 Tax=Hongsoonwoonella zoysiae TaxID=2821844 RepID=UPI0015618117|nr:hypothetical protein [Hongsoonwoonella zoysiae]NRG18085.1 hypothetical protein [Hongsoonwoonella zoysiae]